MADRGSEEMIRRREVFDILDEQIAYILDGENRGVRDEDCRVICFHLMETRRAIEGKWVSFRGLREG